MKVAILDYGVGNLFGIARAVFHVGAEPLITDNRNEIAGADRIILPGVGAFGDAIKNLKDKGMDGLLRECVLAGKAILGVCLGMQLLMSSSEEFGFHEGLNFIKGKVVRFPDPDLYGFKYKIPHVGWNRLFPWSSRGNAGQWNNTVLSKISEKDFFYFVHSYIVVPENKEDALALTKYGNVEFCSVVRKGNVYGCQFHPELSAEAGLRVCRTFIYEDGEAV